VQIILPVSSPMRSPGFVFGVATSAFQIEGAAAARLPCIWDTFCAKPGKIRDRSDARVACDHMARWHEDLDLLAALGVDAYRLSISWPRVIEEGGALNDRGIGFYLQLLDRLNEKRIKPFVTLYHWDLPQYLEDAGGWPNRDTAFRFRDYVDRVTRALGDRVHSYATLNEPWCSAHLGYETGVHAPGLADQALGKRAAHHLLLAHGLGMQVLDRNSPRALNGIVLNFSPCYGASDSAADRAAAEAADVVLNQWYLQPILNGRYPDLIERLPKAERPDVHAGDMDIISHRLGFLGVNYYTRGVYRAHAAEPFVRLPPAGPLTSMGWEIYPQGLTDLLLALKNAYDLPPIYIAENGIAVSDTLEAGEVNDPHRIRFIQEHLEALDSAMRRGVNVAGYFYWSLMDNFEWAEGYSQRFGLVHVDFVSQRRIIKASGHAYRDLLGRRALVGAHDPVAAARPAPPGAA